MSNLNGWMRVGVFLSGICWLLSLYIFFTSEYANGDTILEGAIIPTAFIFGIGYSIAWVRRGFRQ